MGQLELVCSRGMIGVTGIWVGASQKWMRTQDPRSALYRKRKFRSVSIDN